MAEEEANRKFYEELFEEPSYVGTVAEEEKFAEPNYMQEWEEEAPKGSFFEKFDSIRRVILGNKARILVVLLCMYLAYAGIVFYLLYFNAGIAIDASINRTTNSIDVTVRNEASHMIKLLEVRLLVDDEQFGKTKKIGALRQGRETILNFPADFGAGKKITVEASAPFHLTVKRILEVSGLQQIKVRSTLKLSREALIVDQNLLITLELCNLGSALDAIVITFGYDPIFDSESEKFTNISLQKDECGELPYMVSANESGTGEIYFNINAYDYSDKIRKEIKVER